MKEEDFKKLREALPDTTDEALKLLRDAGLLHPKAGRDICILRDFQEEARQKGPARAVIAVACRRRVSESTVQRVRRRLGERVK